MKAGCHVSGRTVSVTLQAQISGYLASMQRASAATSQFASGAVAGVAKHEASIRNLSRTTGLLGAAVAGGVGLAIHTFADFDEAMSNVSATGDDARRNLTALRDAAVDAGGKTRFSATEAAGGIEALAKAGVSAKDTLGGGLAGALNLAASGNLGVADSAETAATAMTQFKLSGKDVPHIADLLAAGAGKAQGEVSDMAMALKQSGLVAAQFGLSLETTTGTLAAFASAGLVGSDAGTSFKTMLLSLASPSKQAADTMKRLGIAAYDTQGNFVGITSLAEQLKTKLGPLSQAQRDSALSTIFGNDAIRAANVLYQQGGQGITDWTNKVNDSGYAARTAATRMDNLKGDVEQLSGAVQTAFIKSSGGGNSFLRELAQDATSAADAFNKLSPVTQQNTLTIAAVAGASLLAFAGLARLAVGVSATRTALAAMNITAATSSATLGKIGVAAGPAAVALLGVAAAGEALSGLGTKIGDQAQVTAQLLQLASSTDEVTKSSVNLDAAFRKSNWADGLASSLFGTIQPVEDLNTALKTATTGGVRGFLLGLDGFSESVIPGQQALEKMSAGIQAVDTSLAGLVSSGKADQAAAAFKKIVDSSGLDSAKVATQFGAYQDALRQTANELGVTTLSAQEMADWMGGKVPPAISAAAAAGDNAGKSFAGIPPTVDKTTKSLEDLVTAAHNASNALLAISGGEISMEAAIDAASASLKKNGKTLDVHTAKGRENQSALNAIVSTTNTYTESLAANNASAVKIVTANERGRKSFIKLADSMGLSRGDAVKLANSLFKIPKDIKAQVAVPGAKLSKKEADDVNKAIKDIPKEKRPAIVVIAQTKGAAAAQAAIDAVHGKTVDLWIATHRTTYYGTKGTPPPTNPKGKAGGGLISGPGTSTSDSIPALLSDGEVVINAASVRSIGVERLLFANATGQLPKFAQGGGVGFAAGGQVNVAALYALIRAATDPLGKVASATRAVEAWTRVLGASAQKTKDAQQNLIEQQRTLADSARQLSDTFRNQFTGQGTDPFSWLTTMRTGAADLQGFANQITKLRKAGLSETLVQQLIGQGAVTGGAAAGQILGGGKNLITALNRAAYSLQFFADKLGYLGATGRGRYAYGGPVSGAGTSTSDSVDIRASVGEWVVPAHAVPANRPALEAMTYGRTVTSHNFARGYAYGGMVSRPNIDAGMVRAALTGMRIAGEMRIHQDRGWIEGVVVDVMDHETGRAVGAF
jgi:TP901 family phage tail tape measure protein